MGISLPPAQRASDPTVPWLSSEVLEKPETKRLLLARLGLVGIPEVIPLWWAWAATPSRVDNAWIRETADAPPLGQSIAGKSPSSGAEQASIALPCASGLHSAVAGAKRLTQSTVATWGTVRLQLRHRVSDDGVGCRIWLVLRAYANDFAPDDADQRQLARAVPADMTRRCRTKAAFVSARAARRKRQGTF